MRGSTLTSILYEQLLPVDLRGRSGLELPQRQARRAVGIKLDHHLW